MSVRLFVICDKEVDVPDLPYLCTIRSDRADGTNIADKRNYCELRAQYWVWKNEAHASSDMVGFFHFRRYLDVEGSAVTEIPAAKRPVPYRIRKRPEIRVDRESLERLVGSFDVIAPTWEYTGVSVRKRYEQSSRQRKEDIERVYRIISERYPAYLDAADRYLEGKGEYYGNIYIMKWRYFEDYCQWLFDILEEYDRQTDDPIPFADGYLGERLFGIYFTWLMSQKDVRCGELPRVHYSIYDDASHNFGRERIVDFFLRPGSRLRALARVIKYRAGEWRHGRERK